MSAIAGSVLGLFGNIITNAVNNVQASRDRAQELELFNRQQDFAFDEARRAEAFSKEEAELAFEREKEMWNMQNAYNSPSEQMKRYADAGLSPYLIYGQGTPGNAQSNPSYNPVTGQKADVLGVPKLTSKARFNFDFSQLMEYQKLDNQKQLVDAQTDNLKSQTESNVITNRYKDANEQLDYALKILKFKYDTGQIDKEELIREQLRIDNEFKKRTLEDRVNQTSMQTELMKLDKSVKEQLIRQHEENIKLAKSQNDRILLDLKLLQSKVQADEFNSWVHQMTGIDPSNTSLPAMVAGLTGKAGQHLINGIEQMFNLFK